jgi:hypothetical protein
LGPGHEVDHGLVGFSMGGHANPKFRDLDVSRPR